VTYIGKNRVAAWWSFDLLPVRSKVARDRARLSRNKSKSRVAVSTASGKRRDGRGRPRRRQSVAPVMEDDRLTDHRAERRHPIGRPRRHVTAMQIGGLWLCEPLAVPIGVPRFEPQSRCVHPDKHG